MSKYSTNSYNTTRLTLNVMAICARQCGVDINNDEIADILYDICSDLEDWPEDEGFGSSDNYGYIRQAKEVLYEGYKSSQSTS